jgi:hypothetical protein
MYSEELDQVPVLRHALHVHLDTHDGENDIRVIVRVPECLGQSNSLRARHGIQFLRIVETGGDASEFALKPLDLSKSIPNVANVTDCGHEDFVVGCRGGHFLIEVVMGGHFDTYTQLWLPPNPTLTWY